MSGSASGRGLDMIVWHEAALGWAHLPRGLARYWRVDLGTCRVSIRAQSMQVILTAITSTFGVPA